jgi:uncharacterized membrane protein
MMNTIKIFLGALWMLLAPAVVGLLAWQAIDKVGKATEAAKANVTLQWVIILIIFIPICAGLFIFGWYSFKGYYAHLPKSSVEITDY